MAKLRNDTRNNNNNNSNNSQIRSSHNSKKPDKWQPLRGWITNTEKDDTDIENWAKRRRQTENRAAKPCGRLVVHSESIPSLSVTSLCASIEDASLFREQSLCESLDPLFRARKDWKSRGKFSERAAIAGDDGSEVRLSGYNGGDQTGDKSLAENGELATSTELQEQTKHDSSQPDDASNGDATRTTTRAGRLHSSSLPSNGKRPTANCQDDQGKATTDHGQRRPRPATDNDCTGSEGDAAEVLAICKNQNGRNADGQCSEQAAGSHQETGQFSHPSGENTRTVRLSYSQSNITLRNPYWCGKAGSNRLSPEHNTPGYPSTHAEAESGSDPESSKSSDCHRTSSDKPTSISQTTAACSDGESGFVKRSDEYSSLANPASQSDCNGSDETCAARRPAIGHRPVSLVLKKVSIQDSGIPNEANKSRALSTPQLPRSATKRHANGLSAKNDVTLNQQMVPLGDLLPAVEQNIKCRMLSTNRKASPETDVVEEIYALDKETMMPTKDKLLSYEDSLTMMREGMELIKLKERQQRILGPPAFRPHPNKTPLQRAKENSTKRIYGQLNYTGNISYTDINKLRWKSASGTLYTASRNMADADGETKSAPATASCGEGSDQQSYAYRSHFYGFTTAESCPDQLSAALIKAGIDPVSNLYQLSKRRKAPAGRPLGGFTSYNAANSTKYLKTTAKTTTKTASDTPACNLTEAGLGHIRGKVGPKMAEVIRRRTHRIELQDDTES